MVRRVFGNAAKSCAFSTASIQPGLGLAVVVMTMVVMMRSRGKRRGGEYQDQEHGSEDLLHRVNLA